MSAFKLFSSKTFPILLVNFIGVFGYSIVIPILIFIVIDMGGNAFIYGALGATYPFFQFLGAPILGRLSDRIGRKRVLIISQLGTFIAWLLFITAFALPKLELWSQDNSVTGSYIMTLPLILIFVARIFDGFTGGNVSVANAYLSDISTDEDRDKNFGQMGASTSIGLVLGPTIAGVLASTLLGEILPLIVASVISLIAIFVIKTRLKENNPCAVDLGESKSGLRRFFQVEHVDCYVEGEIEASPEKKGWSFVIKQPGIPLLYSIYFLTFLAFSLFYAGLPVYANTILKWSTTELGLFFALSGIIMVIVQGPVLTRLSKSVSNQSLILAGALLLAVSFFLFSVQNTIVVYGANALLSVGNGLMWPSFLSLLAGKGNKSIQGAIQGYGNSMGSIASMIGLVLGGILFEVITTSLFSIGAAIFVIIVLIILINLYRESTGPHPVPDNQN